MAPARSSRSICQMADDGNREFDRPERALHGAVLHSPGNSGNRGHATVVMATILDTTEPKNAGRSLAGRYVS